LNDDGTKYQFNEPDLWIDTNIPEFNYGFTNFDNIASSFLTIFVVSTMDQWTKIMQIHLDIFQQLFVQVFFISCVWIIAFFVLNLTIATMLMKYEEVDKEQQSTNTGEMDRFDRELQAEGERIFH
jgi:hypothetical protein